MKERFNKFFNKNFEFTDKGKIKYQSKNSYPTNNEIRLKFNELLEAGGDEPVTQEEIEGWLKELTPELKHKVQKIPGLDYCASWIYQNLQAPNCPYRLSNKGNEINYSEAGMTVNATEENIKNWLWSLNHDSNMGYTVTDIKASLGNLLMKFSALALGEVYNKVKYDESMVAFTDEFVKYLYNHLEIQEDYDIFDNIMKHWMWCLKRKITNQEVVWHMWINFFGATGIGKTQMIHRMFDFMKDYVAEPGIQIFNDCTREYKKFTDNYVLFFEELATGDSKSGYADESFTDSGIAAMKQILTADYLDARVMGTQDQAKVKIKFTPISVANEHLYNIVFDESSMRRFFDFTCGRKIPPRDFTELNDMLARFPEALRGIDESNKNGYFNPNSVVGQKVCAIQKNYLPTKTSTNDWIKFCEVTPDNDMSPGNKFTVADYRLYCNYCKIVGKRSASMQRVVSIIKRMWPSCVKGDDVYLFYEKKVENDEVYEAATRHNPSTNKLLTGQSNAEKLNIINEADDDVFEAATCHNQLTNKLLKLNEVDYNDWT